MNIKGFHRLACGVNTLKLGDINYNTSKIKSVYKKAAKNNVELLVMPELCTTGYSMADLFHQQTLLKNALLSIKELTLITKNQLTTLVIGAPILIDQSIYNCAIVLHDGHILGIVPKTYLPTYNEFYETRWFASSSMLHSDSLYINGEDIPLGTNLIFVNKEDTTLSFGIEICEDLWAPIPPSNLLSLNGANIILNLSASNELISKSDYRKDLIKNQSARTITSYLYTSSGFGESTTDVVYGGHSIIASNGSILQENSRFSLTDSLIYEDIDLDKQVYDRMHSNTYRECAKNNISTPFKKIYYSQQSPLVDVKTNIDSMPFVPSSVSKRKIRCAEIFNIQAHGLAKRLSHIGTPTAIIGISGGLDSTLALLVTVKAFDILNRSHKDIIGITMPGFGTTDRTYTNAISLMKSLGITIREISIVDSVKQHFRDINHSIDNHNITYENSQARERTQILMDLSNKFGGIVIGTGDLSELALGWATYNGDHMSMYGVNSTIPKTLVRYLVSYVADTEAASESRSILLDILDTPVSPELLPPKEDGTISQITEDVVGPYELHDFFLYYLLRFGFSPKKIYALAIIAFNEKYSKKIILKWLTIFVKRFFTQQFKRSALPDGPKVGSICISPRGDLRMPSDTNYTIWLDELENLK